MKKINKASAAAFAGALVTVAAAFIPLSPTEIAAVGTVLSTLLVYFVPNKA